MKKDISDQKDEKIIIKGRLNGKQKKKLVNLMNMMYSPSEIANEIGLIVEMYIGFIFLWVALIRRV